MARRPGGWCWQDSTFTSAVRGVGAERVPAPGCKPGSGSVSVECRGFATLNRGSACIAHPDRSRLSDPGSQHRGSPPDRPGSSTQPERICRSGGPVLEECGRESGARRPKYRTDFLAARLATLPVTFGPASQSTSRTAFPCRSDRRALTSTGCTPYPWSQSCESSRSGVGLTAASSESGCPHCECEDDDMRRRAHVHLSAKPKTVCARPPAGYHPSHPRGIVLGPSRCLDPISDLPSCCSIPLTLKNQARRRIGRHTPTHSHSRHYPCRAKLPIGDAGPLAAIVVGGDAVSRPYPCHS